MLLFVINHIIDTVMTCGIIFMNLPCDFFGHSAGDVNCGRPLAGRTTLSRQKVEAGLRALFCHAVKQNESSGLRHSQGPFLTYQQISKLRMVVATIFCLCILRRISALFRQNESAHRLSIQNPKLTYTSLCTVALIFSGMGFFRAHYVFMWSWRLSPVQSCRALS